MATVKTAHGRYESYIAVAEESTFGTAVADNAAMKKLDVIGGNTPSFNPEYYEDSALRNAGKNIVDIDHYYSTSNGLWQRYQIPDFIAPADILAEFLYAAVQTVSEAGTSPYSKTYSLDGTTDPNFSSNQGYFMTVLVKHPQASESQKLTSCVVDNLRIRFSPDNGGRAVCSATVRTGKGWTATSNPTGTHSFSSVVAPNFHNSTSTLTINGLDMVWYSLELNIQSRYDWIGYSNGVADNYKYLGSTINVSAVVKYDSNSDAFLRSKASDINSLSLIIGSSGSAGYFSVQCNNTVLKDVTTDTGDDETVEKLNLEMELMLKASASDTIDFAITDGVDHAW
jgi:hypothetical protein